MERARLLARRLGRWLHTSRKKWGLTQAQIAARCEMAARHYGRLERGDTEVTLTALDRLTQGFECDLEDLIVQI
ncbi:MAG: helix-turn-helix domain-containing protein, partial [Vicinamibacteraceae bacterium]